MSPAPDGMPMPPHRMDPAPEPTAPVPTGPGPAEAQAAHVVTAFRYTGAYLFSMVAIFWIAGATNHLGGLDELVGPSVGPAELAPSGPWAVSNALFAATLLLWVGSPRNRIAPWIDLRALYGVVWMGWRVLVAAAFFLTLDTGPRPQGCAGGCDEYAWIVLAPVLAALAVQAVQAFLPLSWPWWVRALPAPAVFALATVVQLLVWDRYAVPLLHRAT